MASQQNAGRTVSLDGLRGVAALTVVFNHLAVGFFPGLYYGLGNLFHYPQEAMLWDSPAALLWAGNFSVCVFFVMSGYALSSMCAFSKLHLIPQLVRRYIRLTFPVFIISLLAFAIHAFGGYHNLSAAAITRSSEWLATFHQSPPSFSKALLDSLVNVYVNKFGPLLYDTGVLWTIRYEMMGSVLIILLAYALGRRINAKAYSFLLAGLTVLLAVPAFKLNSVYLSLFTVGALFFELRNQTQKIPTLLAGVATALALYLGSLPMTMTDYALPALRPIDPVALHAVGAVILVYVVLKHSLLSPALNSRFSQFLGKISYALYLTHFLVICSLTSYLFLTLHAQNVPYGQNVAIISLVSLPVIIGLAWLVTSYVDNPGVSLSKTVATRLNNWMSPAKAATPSNSPNAGELKLKALSPSPVVTVHPKTTETPNPSEEQATQREFARSGKD